jgi:intergrase/recombinase
MNASIAQSVEQQPCKEIIGHNFNWADYQRFLQNKYPNKKYANLQFSYTKRFFECYANPEKILLIPTSIRANALKALVCLSKALGEHEIFKSRLKNHGIKWINENSFSAFLGIVNNSHKDLLTWYHNADNALTESEKLYLKFCLLSGLRCNEAIESYNLCISLYREGHLNDYFDPSISILQHFKEPWNKMFLRTTKNAFITAISAELLKQICDSKPVSYSAIHKRLSKARIRLRIKELRSYYATYLRNHGILSEYIDLFQGRVGKQVFIRNYLKIEDLKALVSKILTVVKDLETQIA